MHIPFNKPYMTGKELSYIAEAHKNGMLAGDGPFTKRCHDWLEQHLCVYKALLTHSCTAALELAAILLNIEPGDEVIMPSYTFVSTANAFVLRGAVPVFIDIRADTMNIDESKIEEAITPKTRAIVPVHYAGVACEMDEIMSIANRHGIMVIEDAAQGIMSTYKGRPLGSIGHLGCLSFHETKNIISGEGGALLINDPELIERAEIIREKGTNRNQYFRGQVDKYSWVDIGSSYLPGELIAAFLWAQMEDAESIINQRLLLWEAYKKGLNDLEKANKIKCPTIPSLCVHNAHMFYIVLIDNTQRVELIEKLKQQNIHTVFHYTPLHGSSAGKRFSRISGDISTTESIADRLLRLPLWVGLDQYQYKVIDALKYEIPLLTCDD